MAAQEYYGGGPSMPILQGPPTGPFPLPQQNGTAFPPRPQNQQQPPQPPRPSTSNGQAPPYPLSDTPPPAYSAFNPQQPPQRASSQPPPQNFQPYRPNVDTHQYPPEKLSVPQRPSTLQNMSRPSDYAAQYPPPSQYPPPPVQPPNGMYQQVGPGLGSLSQVYGSQRPPRRSSTSGASPYRRDSRSRSRSRSRDSRERKHRHHHPNSRPQAQRQKSSGVNTFLGAGGGAIVGDLIFPGLGTLGGAILGGVGGHEYGRKRPQSNSSKGSRRKGETYEEEYRRGRK